MRTYIQHSVYNIKISFICNCQLIISADLFADLLFYLTMYLVSRILFVFIMYFLISIFNFFFQSQRCFVAKYKYEQDFMFDATIARSNSSDNYCKPQVNQRYKNCINQVLCKGCFQLQIVKIIQLSSLVLNKREVSIPVNFIIFHITSCMFDWTLYKLWLIAHGLQKDNILFTFRTVIDLVG